MKTDSEFPVAEMHFAGQKGAVQRIRPTFAEATRFWLKLGCISFGGPAGQIAIMHRELVEEKKWVGEGQFVHALDFCMLLPGPEAQQLAIYLGWLLHRGWGGVVAGVLFVLPSVLVLWALSLAYVLHAETSWLAGVFYGLKPAVIAIVIGAAWRIGRKTLRNPWSWGLATGSLVTLNAVPFPVIIVIAGIVGAFFPGTFLAANVPAPGASEIVENGERRTAGGAFRVVFTCLLLWWLPVLLVALWLGTGSTLFRMSLFFSKAAVVTFGGAYAILPYVSQEAVATFHWLQPGQMLDGLGLAETTPGPLIMVLQFVGFVGAWQHPGDLPPLLSATLGAALTTWVTFLPSFLWVLLGAPYVEGWRQNRRFSAILAAITAAVVGVVAHLAIWFAGQVFFPAGRPVDWLAVGLAMAAIAALQWGKMNVLLVIFAAAAIGVLKSLAG